MRSFVPQIAEELSQTRNFLTITTKTKRRRIQKGLVKLKSAILYCPLTIKRIFAKGARENDT
jgi:hypothetical protein